MDYRESLMEKYKVLDQREGGFNTLYTIVSGLMMLLCGGVFIYNFFTKWSSMEFFYLTLIGSIPFFIVYFIDDSIKVNVYHYYDDNYPEEKKKYDTDITKIQYFWYLTLIYVSKFVYSVMIVVITVVIFTVGMNFLYKDGGLFDQLKGDRLLMGIGIGVFVSYMLNKK